MAQIQHKLGIKGSYYFRIFPKKDNEAIIKQIAALGHEIGYHYDDLTVCKGNHQKAIVRFQKNLNYLRQFAPVSTITMEGAPLSKYDNRMLWLGRLEELAGNKENEVGSKKYVAEGIENEVGSRKYVVEKKENEVGSKKYVVGETMNVAGSRKYIAGDVGNEVDTDKSESKIPYLLLSTHYLLGQHNSELPKYNYRDYGIEAEPYFDINFNELYYLTDTGRRWDGHLYNVRDKATKKNPITNPEFLKLRFHSTQDIIDAVNDGTFPKQAMLNFHPQRWNDALVPWAKELVWQNAKNQGKRFLVKK